MVKPVDLAREKECHYSFEITYNCTNNLRIILLVVDSF